MSALSIFDQLVVLGCFFHFGQCLLRKVQSSRMVSVYKSNDDFGKLVRRCISLPFVKLNEIQETVDQLRDTEINDETVDDMKNEFLDYIQQTWLDGPYPPQTWNCHGRNNENTNNNLERYNGTLNRLILVQHPNAYVLLSHFVTEICSSITTIEQLHEGKVIVPKRNIYVKLGEERRELQKRYQRGLISRMDFLLRMGFKLIKLNQESNRKESNELFEIPVDVEVNGENSETESVHSFEEAGHPYEGRQVGVRAGAGTGEQYEQDVRMKKKKCTVCDKRFVNGKIRKSKVTECISCNRLTHERCAAGYEHSVFKCVVCRSVEEEEEDGSIEPDSGSMTDGLYDEGNNETEVRVEGSVTEEEIEQNYDLNNFDMDLAEDEFVAGIPTTSSVKETIAAKKNTTSDEEYSSSNRSEEEFTNSLRLSESLQELINPPSESMILKETEENRKRSEELQEFEQIRRERIEVLEDLEAKSEANKEAWELKDKMMKQRELVLKDRCRENRDKIVNTLTDEDVENLVMQNLEYLEAIIKGDIPSWRQEKFGTPFSDALLRTHWMGEPFSDQHFHRIGYILDNRYDREHVQAVLLPEMLIKMYKDFLYIDSRKKAEEMMNNVGSFPIEESVDFGECE